MTPKPVKLTKGQTSLLRRIFNGEYITWNNYNLILRGATGKVIRADWEPLEKAGLVRRDDTNRSVVSKLLITPAGRAALAPSPAPTPDPLTVPQPFDDIDAGIEYELNKQGLRPAKHFEAGWYVYTTYGKVWATDLPLPSPAPHADDEIQRPGESHADWLERLGLPPEVDTSDEALAKLPILNLNDFNTAPNADAPTVDQVAPPKVSDQIAALLQKEVEVLCPFCETITWHSRAATIAENWICINCGTQHSIEEPAPARQPNEADVHMVELSPDQSPRVLMSACGVCGEMKPDSEMSVANSDCGAYSIAICRECLLTGREENCPDDVTNEAEYEYAPSEAEIAAMQSEPELTLSVWAWHLLGSISIYPLHHEISEQLNTESYGGLVDLLNQGCIVRHDDAFTITQYGADALERREGGAGK